MRVVAVIRLKENQILRSIIIILFGTRYLRYRKVIFVQKYKLKSKKELLDRGFVVGISLRPGGEDPLQPHLPLHKRCRRLHIHKIVLFYN
jgi:hypothetical protein